MRPKIQPSSSAPVIGPSDRVLEVSVNSNGEEQPLLRTPSGLLIVHDRPATATATRTTAGAAAMEYRQREAYGQLEVKNRMQRQLSQLRVSVADNAPVGSIAAGVLSTAASMAADLEDLVAQLERSRKAQREAEARRDLALQQMQRRVARFRRVEASLVETLHTREARIQHLEDKISSMPSANSHQKVRRLIRVTEEIVQVNIGK